METLTVKACRETWLCVYWFVSEKTQQETKTDGYCARPMGETLTFGSAGCTHSLYYNSAYGTALVFNSSIEKLLASRDSWAGVERQSLLWRRKEKGFFINGTWLGGFLNVIPMLFFFAASECVQKGVTPTAQTGRQQLVMSCSLTSHCQNKLCAWISC